MCLLQTCSPQLCDLLSSSCVPTVGVKCYGLGMESGPADLDLIFYGSKGLYQVQSRKERASDGAQ